jgi:hypothetical protein
MDGKIGMCITRSRTGKRKEKIKESQMNGSGCFAARLFLGLLLLFLAR